MSKQDTYNNNYPCPNCGADTKYKVHPENRTEKDETFTYFEMICRNSHLLIGKLRIKSR